MDLLAREHDAGARCILDRELGLAARAGDAPDRTREVVALQRFDVFDFERFDVSSLVSTPA